MAFFNLLGVSFTLLLCIFPAAQTILFSFGQTMQDTVNESTALNVAVPIVMTTTPSNAILRTDTIVNISVTGGSATCMSSAAHDHSHVQLFYLLHT